MSRKLKALLIYPPDRNLIFGTLPEAIERKRGFIPPVGLMYIAAYVNNRSEHEALILDAPALRLDYPALEREIARVRPHVIGIQALTLSLVDVVETGLAAKRAAPDAAIVLGGPHANLFPDECMALDFVDAVVLGEGEISFTRWLDAYAGGGGFESIPGLVYRDGGGIVKTRPPELIRDLDSLPMPDRRDTPWRLYSSFLAARSPFNTMMTSRGCPFACLFCNRAHLGVEFRAHSPGRVVDEMQHCGDLGVRELFFHDDTFTLDRDRALAICDEIGARGLKVAWSSRTRVDMVDAELLQAMKKSGATRINFGVESGSQTVLDNLRKGITLAQARQAFRLAHAAGLHPLADFMIGSPGETPDDIRATIGFARSLKPDWVQFSVTTIMPGTELEKLAVQRGVIEPDAWRGFALDPRPDFTPPVWDETLSRQEIMDWERKAYRAFYLRPGYAVQRLKRLRSPADMRRKLLAAVELFRL